MPGIFPETRNLNTDSLAAEGLAGSVSKDKGEQSNLGVFEYMLPGVHWLLGMLNTGTSFLMVGLLFAMIYKYLPDVEITWKDVGIGAGITAILFTAGKFFIGIYLVHTAIAGAYGAAGSLVVLLIWVYYSALISFFGAEFTQVYTRRYGSGIRPKSYAIWIGQKSDA